MTQGFGEASLPVRVNLPNCGLPTITTASRVERPQELLRKFALVVPLKRNAYNWQTIVEKHLGFGEA
jgi:hypothetical protein